MIEAFRHDDIIDKFGGRFKLAALIQRRWLQLLQGARPMVETRGLTDLEVVVKEIMEEKIDLTFPENGVIEDGEQPEEPDSGSPFL
ncbi:MAG: DNA-directed RNA polymerase subunit omega [Phycisphaerae bacterium]|jgi:DNA-directed RNA polymerase subunit omega